MKWLLVIFALVISTTSVLAANLDTLPQDHQFIYQIMETNSAQNQLTVFGTEMPYFSNQFGQKLYKYTVTYASSCQFVKNAPTPAENAGVPVWLITYLPDNKLDGLGGDKIYSPFNADGSTRSDNVEECDIVSGQSLGLLPQSYMDYLADLNGIPRADMQLPTGDISTLLPADKTVAPAPKTNNTVTNKTTNTAKNNAVANEVVTTASPLTEKKPVAWYWYLAGGVILVGGGYWLMRKRK